MNNKFKSNDSSKNYDELINEYNKLLDENTALRNKLDRLSVDELYTNQNLNSDLIDKGFKIVKYTNDNYDQIDGTNLSMIDKSIDTIVKKYFSYNKQECIKDYLLELLFSNKPTLVCHKDSLGLTKLLASLFTGANYYVVDLFDLPLIPNLIEEINKIHSDNEQSIILIRGLINRADYNLFLNQIKSKLIVHKLVFEYNYKAEIRYLPNEILNDFNVVLNMDSISKFEVDSNDKAYKSYLNIDLEQSSYTMNTILKDLDLEFVNDTVYNNGVLGLAYCSIIPFKLIKDKLEIKDCLKLLSLNNIREQLEELFNDK